MRLAHKAWLGPAQIHYDPQSLLWSAEINGERFPPHHDPVHAERVADIWHSGIMIDQAEYKWLIAIREHAQAHAPEHPALHPRKAIDPRRLEPITPRTPIR